MSSATTPIKLKTNTDLGLGNVENKSSAQIRAEIVAADLAGAGNAFAVLPASGATVGAEIGVNFSGQFTSANVTSFFAAKTITAGIIDVTDLFAQSINVTDTIRIGSETSRYLMTLDGRGAASPIAIVEKATGSLVFGFDSDDKPYFSGGLRTGSITNINVFTDEVLTQLMPVVVGATGGVFKLSPIPVTLAGTTTKTITMSPANDSPVTISVSFSDGNVSTDGTTNKNYVMPSYRMVLSRTVNGGASVTLKSQLFTGTATNRFDAEGTGKWFNSFNIQADDTFTDGSHGAVANDTIVYTIAITYNSGTILLPQIKAASCSQQTQGGGVAGVANQLTAPYLGLVDDGQTYPKMEYKNNPAPSSSWLRTPTTGLLPESAGGGSSALGTSSWPFSQIHGKAIYDTGNRVYSATNPNIGSGAANYAAGNHAHDDRYYTKSESHGMAYLTGNDSTVVYGRQGVQFSNFSGLGGTGANGAQLSNPANEWYYHITQAHPNGSGYYADLAIGFHSNYMGFRRVAGGVDYGWNTVYHSGNNNIGSGAGNYAAGNHSHSYLPLGGGSLTGPITVNYAQGVTINASSGWAYQEYRSGAAYAHIGVNDGATDGANAGSLHLRPSGTANGGLMLQPNTRMVHKTTAGTTSIGCLDGNWSHYESSTGKHYFYGSMTVATNISCANFSGGRFAGISLGNDYNSGAFEVIGGGTANSIFPNIGFHQPGLYGSSLQLRGNGDLRFYAQGGTIYGSITASTFNGALSGNASTASVAGKFSNDRSSWAGTTESNVIGQLAWRTYGNGHTIFDASPSTTPSGTACSHTNSTVQWQPSFPTLMGFNGNETYGVRVDTSRLSESCSGNAATASLATSVSVSANNASWDWQPVCWHSGNSVYSSGVYLKGSDNSLLADRYFSARSGAVSSLSGLTEGNGALTVNHTNSHPAGTQLYYPTIASTTLQTTGYRQHLSIGHKRNSGWGHAYIAVGGHDSYPTYEWLFSGNDGLFTCPAGISAVGAISGQRVIAGFDSGVSGSVSCSAWFRSSGDTGWYNSTYGGGLYMENSTWIKVFGGKKIHLPAVAMDSLQVGGGIQLCDNNLAYTGFGITGVYNPDIFQGVFSMGQSWQLPANGSSSGNLYGIAWTHSNNTNANAKKVSGHHAVFMTNGVTGAAIGDSIWTKGTVTGSDCIATSDRRVKDNLVPIKDAMAKVDTLTGYTFDRKDMDGRRHAGLIAQDVREVLPEAIFGTPEHLQLSSTAVVGLLVEAIKELSARVKQLEAA